MTPTVAPTPTPAAMPPLIGVPRLASDAAVVVVVVLVVVVVDVVDVYGTGKARGAAVSMHEE